MKSNQLIAIAGIIVVGLLIAYGISLIPIPSRPVSSEVSPAFRTFLEEKFSLDAQSDITIDKQIGNFYKLNIYPNPEEGGGYWALVEKTSDGITVIDSGNKSYASIDCALLASNAVPAEIAPYCLQNGDITNRMTGAVASAQELQQAAE